MSFSLANMPPKQKQMLMIGVPVVAAFALISVVSKKKSAGATGNVGNQAPSTDVIGVGQLAEFENSVNGVLAQQGNTLDTIKLNAEVDAQNAIAAADARDVATRAALSASLQDQTSQMQSQLSALSGQLDGLSRAAPATVAAPAPPPTPSTPPPSAIPAALPPGTAVAIPNPIPGDGSSVAVGKLADSNTFTYGGNAGQVALLTEATPVHTVSQPAPAPRAPVTVPAKLKAIKH